jgi:dTDP-4-dehydrorhamnose 3,5-epimerase-like enzyme
MSVINLESFQNGPKILEIPKFSDLRGSFEILFELNKITENETNFPNIIQWNCIRAKQTSVRGFHGAKESAQHWKVLTCVSGKIRDAYLDIRPQSKTFGCVGHIDLEQENSKLIVIPPGFAHAFECITPESLVIYGTNIAFDDQTEIDISPIDFRYRAIWENAKLLSDRDMRSATFANLEKLGTFEK